MGAHPDTALVIDTAAKLDKAFCAFVILNLQARGIDPMSSVGAATAVAVAGIIAGRAEDTVEPEPELQAIYDLHRAQGRQWAANERVRAQQEAQARAGGVN